MPGLAGRAVLAKPATGAAPVSITDDFSGAAASMSGRTTTTGNKTWVIPDGSFWDVNGSGKAYRSSGSGGAVGGPKITVDAGISDCTASVLIPDLPTSEGHGLVFRMVDNSNFWVFYPYKSGGGTYGYFLRNWVAGSMSYDSGFVNPVGSAGAKTAQVVLLGTSIKCYYDGVLREDISSSTHQSGTKFGLYAEGGSVFDDFAVSS